MFLKLFKQLNPERNIKVRSVLYVIGAGGTLHLLTLLCLSIIKRDIHFFNPFYTVDIDQIWPATRDNMVLYAIGWAGFAVIIALTYAILKRRLKPKGE